MERLFETLSLSLAPKVFVTLLDADTFLVQLNRQSSPVTHKFRGLKRVLDSIEKHAPGYLKSINAIFPRQFKRSMLGIMLSDKKKHERREGLQACLQNLLDNYMASFGKWSVRPLRLF